MHIDVIKKHHQAVVLEQYGFGIGDHDGKALQAEFVRRRI